MADETPHMHGPLGQGGDKKDEALLLGMSCSIPLGQPARRVVELAGCLACPDDGFVVWAEAAGASRGRPAADEEDDMIHELDAVAARLYGPSGARLVDVFETFREGRGFAARLDGASRRFQAWGRR